MTTDTVAMFADADGGWSVAQVISHTGQAVAILRDRDAMPEGS